VGAGLGCLELRGQRQGGGFVGWARGGRGRSDGGAHMDFEAEALTGSLRRNSAGAARAAASPAGKASPPLSPFWIAAWRADTSTSQRRVDHSFR